MTDLRILIIIFAGLLALSIIYTSHVYAYQEIIEINAPDTVAVGVNFPVTLSVEYDFSNEESVKIWAGIRDSSRKYVVIPDVPATLVSGKGEVKWQLGLGAPLQAGDWQLEAYVFHKDTDESEIIDSTKSFTVKVVPLAEPDVEISEIKTNPPNFKTSLGRNVTIILSIRYQNLSSDYIWPLRAVIRDGVTGKDLSEVHSEPLTPGNGNYTFPLLEITPRRNGEWPLQLGVGLKDCPTNLCGIQEFFTKYKFSILVDTETVEEEHETQFETEEFEFSIVADPTIQSANSNNYLTFNIHIRLEKGEPQQLILKASNLPPNSNYSFNPQMGIPDFDSKLSIQMHNNVTPGSYFINITGEGTDLTKSIIVEAIIATETTLDTQSSATSQVETPQPSPIKPNNNEGNLDFVSLVTIIVTVSIPVSIVYIIWRRQKNLTT